MTELYGLIMRAIKAETFTPEEEVRKLNAKICRNALMETKVGDLRSSVGKALSANLCFASEN